MFCRNCGKELVATPDKTCRHCGANAVKATSFCRYCGNATTAKDITCPKCGVSIGILAKSGEVSNKASRGWSTKTKTILILAAVIFVAAYTVLTLTPRTLAPLQSALSHFVVSTTGYTATPLDSLSASPPKIPRPTIAEDFYVAGISINATQQLNVYAVYKNPTTKATRLEEVTANCTFQSSNDRIATVTAGGLVKAVATGSTTITASYTAVRGSANISSAAEGKVPITVTVTVPVLVR